MNELNVVPEMDVDVDVRVNGKAILEKVQQTAASFGFCPKNQKSMIATIVVKGISLFLGILFLALRGKAKAEGKVCKSRVFLALSALFFVGVVTSSANIPEEEDDFFDDDFDADFETESEAVNE
ncbi:MAG: hypothetical protein FWC71_01180 [Defluviitaleaceae bacterium]|nr:hypothetical protein [Defluviitaleaceae bacterium]